MPSCHKGVPVATSRDWFSARKLAFWSGARAGQRRGHRRGLWSRVREILVSAISSACLMRQHDVPQHNVLLSLVIPSVARLEVAGLEDQIAGCEGRPSLWIGNRSQQPGHVGLLNGPLEAVQQPG